MSTPSTDQPIAILGAGNGGCAMAADLATRGYRINLYEHPDFSSSFEEIIRSHGISMSGACGQKEALLNLATTDLRRAIEGVDLINLVVPSTAQELFIKALVDVVRPSQTVVVWAGRFGALEFARIWKSRHGDKPMPRVAETDTLPYGVRKPSPASVRILYTSTRLLVGSMPAREGEAVAAELRKLYPEMQAVGNVLAAALANPALVVYGIGALLNVARIERMQGKFYLFDEGITPAVASVMHQAYGEMSGVAEAYRCPIPQFPREAFDGPLSLEGACFKAPEAGGGFAAMDGPRDVKGRYMMENIGDALSPIAELGHLAGVATPLLNALVTLGSTICGVDFRTQGRNLARLGLGASSAPQIIELIEGRSTPC